MPAIVPHASDGMRSIIDYLRQNPGEHSVSDVADGASLNRNTAKVFLRRCLHYGWIINERRGVYQAAPDATPAIFTDDTPTRRGSDNYPSRR